MSNYLELHRLPSVKLIIGNGFDLACGLKSDYGSFFHSSHSLYEEIKACINQEKEDYPREATLWDMIFLLCKEIQENPLSHPDSVSWKDIETVMRKVLGFDQYYDIDLNKIYLNQGAPDCLNEHEQKILRYLQVRNRNQGFYPFVYSELLRFEKRFSDYISSLMTPEYQENAKRMLNDPLLLNLNLAQLIAIDSFNYTSPNYFLTNLRDDKKIALKEDGKHPSHFNNFDFRHINGKINDAIFGIDSHDIPLSDPRYIFTKVYRKMISLVEGKREDHRRFFKNVVIYGHSLGEADYSYFFSVLEGLDLYNYRQGESRLVLAFSDYSPTARLEVAQSMLKLLDAYDHWKNPKSTRHGLTEILETCDRVGFAKIDTSILKK